jgi:hypothetical protein
MARAELVTSAIVTICPLGSVLTIVSARSDSSGIASDPIIRMAQKRRRLPDKLAKSKAHLESNARFTGFAIG